MALSDDAREAIGGAMGDMAPSTDEWRDYCTDNLSQAVMDAVLPDGRTIAQALDENTALRALVGRFYTQAWEDPLTDDEMDLLDPIVNEAMDR